jgi:hypothetical protein
MKIKQILVILLIAGTAPAGFSESEADWKTELAVMLEETGDHAAALDRLQSILTETEGEDRMTAEALAAWLFWKTGDAASERRSIVAFFETYGDTTPFFGFLGTSARRDFLNFWTRWAGRYPLITDIHLLIPVDQIDTGPPGELEIGIEIANEALYKISSEGIARGGGLWKPGFRILRVVLPKPFRVPFAAEYLLELKTGDLTILRTIRIEADILSRTPLETTPVSDFDAPAEKSLMPAAGELALYVGDELILIVRKTAPRTASLKFPLPGPSMPGQKPYLPPPKDDPMAMGVSILDAIGAAAKAVGDLTRKKPLPPARPTYRKSDERTVTFIQREDETSVYRVLAGIRLHTEKARISGRGF